MRLYGSIFKEVAGTSMRVLLITKKYYIVYKDSQDEKQGLHLPTIALSIRFGIKGP
jgi:hypothetical protein